MSVRESGHARPVNLRDVATLAGVDISTASRALTGQRKVRAATLQRVTEAAARLGYAPNQAARNLRLSRTMTIGVVIRYFDTSIYLDAIEGMGSILDEHGYTLMITTARGDAEHYRRLIQRLFARRVDALLLWTPPAVGRELDQFTSLSIPVAALSTPGPDAPGIPHLWVSEDEPIHAAVQRLAGLGHRSLLYLRSPRSGGRDRLAPLQSESARAGLHFADALVPVDQPATTLAGRLRQWLGQSDRPTALITDNHHFSQLIAALQSLNLRLPADLSLAAFARQRWADDLWLPTATVQTDAVAFGRQVAETLIGWLGGERPPDAVQVPLARWVERGSIGPAPGR